MSHSRGQPQQPEADRPVLQVSLLKLRYDKPVSPPVCMMIFQYTNVLLYTVSDHKFLHSVQYCKLVDGVSQVVIAGCCWRQLPMAPRVWTCVTAVPSVPRQIPQHDPNADLLKPISESPFHLGFPFLTGWTGAPPETGWHFVFGRKRRGSTCTGSSSIVS